jgi:hypothetical protein
MRIVFPVVKGKISRWPEEPLCPMCRKARVFEPHSMACIDAGALKVNRKRDTGGPSDDLDGFLHLSWHGAHDSGMGDDRDIFCNLEVIKDVRGGQGELYFCSTTCLRAFLNACVDALEQQIRRATTEQQRRSNKAL